MNAILRAGAETLRQLIHPLSGAPADWDPLLTLAHDARVVVIGVESGGAHELQRDRAAITRRLIETLGFGVVAVDSDCPSAARVDHYLRGSSVDTTAEESLRGFRRFPTWAFRNSAVLDFAGWLRSHNDAAPRARVSFCGIDAAGMHAAIDMILAYLDAEDTTGAAEARWRFASLEHFSDGECDKDLELARSRTDLLLRQLFAVQCEVVNDGTFAAEIGADIDAFDRELLAGRRSALAHRNRVMAVTALRAGAGHRRVVIWTSNANAGDARMTRGGPDVTIGSILREHFGAECVLIGLTAHGGTITAASRWGGRAERIRLMPALPESCQSLLYEIDCPRFLITLRDKAAVAELDELRLQRTLSSVYLPESERASHYIEARLSEQFDAVVHHDEVRGTEPL